MAASILSQDILAICFFLAEGNIDLSMEEVIRRAENYQEMQDRHFGITRSDFRNLFLRFVGGDLGSIMVSDKLSEIRLSDITYEVLNFRSAHFNDEGECWMMGDDVWNENEKYWYGYDEKTYKEKVIIKEKMKLLLNSKEPFPVYATLLKEFMNEIKLTEAILYYCSRSGSSS